MRNKKHRARRRKFCADGKRCVVRPLSAALICALLLLGCGKAKQPVHREATVDLDDPNPIVVVSPDCDKIDSFKVYRNNRMLGTYRCVDKVPTKEDTTAYGFFILDAGTANSPYDYHDAKTTNCRDGVVGYVDAGGNLTCPDGVYSIDKQAAPK